MGERAPCSPPPAGNPFAPGNDEAYARWRDRKLAARARSAADLVVEVRDPRALDRRREGRDRPPLPARQHGHLREPRHRRRTRRCRGAWARSSGSPRSTPTSSPTRTASRASPSPARRRRRASSPTPPTASAGTPTATTTRRSCASARCCCTACATPPPGATPRSSTTSSPTSCCATTTRRTCARSWQPDALTIPARVDDDGVARPEAVGTGLLGRARHGRPAHALHRADAERGLEGRRAPRRQRRRACSQILDGDSGCVLRTRLAPGMGLVCNNVLHERSAFEDDPGAPAPALPRALRRAHRRHRAMPGWKRKRPACSRPFPCWPAATGLPALAPGDAQRVLVHLDRLVAAHPRRERVEERRARPPSC